MTSKAMLSITFASACFFNANTCLAEWIDTVQGSQQVNTIGMLSRPSITFTTGTNSGYQINDLKLQLSNVDTQPRTFTFDASLYAVNGSNFPTGTALATASLNTGSMAANANVLLDFNTLGALGNYTLAGNTNYALTLENGSQNSLLWKVADGTPVTNNGFAYVQSSTWSTLIQWSSLGSNNFMMQLSGTSNDVPEPTSLSLLGLGMALLAVNKKRTC